MIPANPLKNAFLSFANPISVLLPDGSSLDSCGWISPVQKSSFPSSDELHVPYDSPQKRSFFLIAPPDSRIHEFSENVSVVSRGDSFLVVRANLVSLKNSPIYVWALLIPHPDSF